MELDGKIDEESAKKGTKRKSPENDDETDLFMDTLFNEEDQDESAEKNAKLGKFDDCIDISAVFESKKKICKHEICYFFEEILF